MPLTDAQAALVLPLDPAHNGAQWPDVLVEIRASEVRVRTDILEVKTEVTANKLAIDSLRMNSAQQAQATKDLFRTGNAVRTLILMALAAAGFFMGIINLL